MTSIHLVSLLCCVVVYLAVGIIWNYKWKGERGVNLIPNLNFWTSLPGLVKVCLVCLVLLNTAIRMAVYSPTTRCVYWLENLQRTVHTNNFKLFIILIQKEEETESSCNRKW